MLYGQRKHLFFLVGQIFLLSFQWFNYLAEIFLIFGRNKLSPLFVDFTIGHNPFLPLAWPTKRGREQSVERDFGKSASCHISVYRPYFLRYGFQQDNFQYFSLLVFSFLGNGRKSRIVCRRRSRSYSGGDKSLTRLPPTCLVWQSRRKSTRLPIAASPKGRLRTFPLPSLSSIGGFYMPASLRFLLSDCMACNQIFLLFHPNLSLFRLPPFRCGLHRIASVGRPRSGAKVIPGCYAAARLVPSVLEKISTPTLHCVLFRVVFSLKNLAFAHPYLCEAPETKTTDATGRRIKKNVG